MVKDGNHPSKYLKSVSVNISPCQNFVLYSIPSRLKEVEYLSLRHIYFTSAHGTIWTLVDHIKVVGDSRDQLDENPCVADEKPKKVGISSTV